MYKHILVAVDLSEESPVLLKKSSWNCQTPRRKTFYHPR